VVIGTDVLVLVGVVLLEVVLLAVKWEHVPFLVVVQSGLVVLFRGIVVGRGEFGGDLLLMYRGDIGLGTLKVCCWPLVRVAMSNFMCNFTQGEVFSLGRVVVDWVLLVLVKLELVPVDGVGLLEEHLVSWTDLQELDVAELPGLVVDGVPYAVDPGDASEPLEVGPHGGIGEMFADPSNEQTSLLNISKVVSPDI